MIRSLHLPTAQNVTTLVNISEFVILICQMTVKFMEEQLAHNNQEMICYVLHEGLGKSVTVHAMKAYREAKGTTPLILNLNARWR